MEEKYDELEREIIDSLSLGAPGNTIEQHQNKLVILAMRLAQKKLEDGTASSQIISHYLALGTELSKLAIERARLENQKIEQQIANASNQETMTEMYTDLLVVLKSYSV